MKSSFSLVRLCTQQHGACEQCSTMQDRYQYQYQCSTFGTVLKIIIGEQVDANTERLKLNPSHSVYK